MLDARNRALNLPSDDASWFARGYATWWKAFLNSRDTMPDPIGEDHEQGRLRSMGKWRFVVVRGILGFAVPLCFWMALSDTFHVIRVATLHHTSAIPGILRSWVGAIFISTTLGAITGLLAWRRLTSDYWPNTKADPESTLTRMDPL